MISDMRTLSASMALALGVGMIGTSFARVGWTKAECEAKYGAPVGTRESRLVKSDAEADVFQYNDIEVVAEYRADKVWMISYTGRKMTETNAEKVLANYGKDGGKANWKAGDFLGATHWNDIEGGLHGTLYGSPQSKLVVFSALAIKASYKPRTPAGEEVTTETEAGKKAAEESPKKKEPKPVKKDPFEGF